MGPLFSSVRVSAMVCAASLVADVAVVSAAVVPRVLAAPVTIRHDRSDDAYRELAVRFPATCEVGPDGQGVLVAPRWVLTAAHVARGVTPFSATVRFGGVRRNEGGQVLRVDRVEIHPAFTEAPDHIDADLALLRLARPVSGIEPVPLALGDVAVGQEAFLVGNGMSGDGLTGAVDEDGLWRAATNSVAEVLEDRLHFVFDRGGAAGELEGFWGPGDSGGPVYVEREGGLQVLAVSSHGVDSLDDGKAASYGDRDASFRVSHVSGWLQETLATPDQEQGNLPAARPIEEAPLPDTAAARCVQAYLDARNALSAEGRGAFEERWLAEERRGDVALDEVWLAGRLPLELDGLGLVAWADHGDGRLAALVRTPHIDEGLVLTLGLDGQDRLESVDLGLAPPDQD